MATDQVDGGCEQARAGASSFHPDLLVLTVQEVIGAVPDKLSQGVAWKEEDGWLNRFTPQLPVLPGNRSFKNMTPEFSCYLYSTPMHQLFIPHIPLPPAALFHLTFKLKATKCTKGKGDAPHITGLWDIGETRGGQLVGKALWHAWMSQRLVHQNKREHFQ